MMQALRETSMRIAPCLKLFTVAAFTALAGCTTSGPVLSADAQVDEMIIRCKARQNTPARPGHMGGGTDGGSLSKEMTQQAYLAALNPLRSDEGLAALERRTRNAVDPISQFCTLEGLVRTDPDRARKVWTELQNNPNLAYFVLRDDYLREALKPYPGNPVR
jgi:hypothetical protein